MATETRRHRGKERAGLAGGQNINKLCVSAPLWRIHMPFSGGLEIMAINSYVFINNIQDSFPWCGYIAYMRKLDDDNLMVSSLNRKKS
jgi:hypothetical protein